MSGASNEIMVFTVPSKPKTGQKVAFVARTSDAARAVRIEIFVSKRKVKACNDSVCMYLGGPFPASTMRYAANAFDKGGKRITTGWKTVTIRAIDTKPPVLQVSHRPARPRANQRVTISASAKDPGGVARIEIKVDGHPTQKFTGATASLTVGPFPQGMVNYEVSAYDKAGNRAWSGRKSFVVTAAPPPGRSTIAGRVTNHHRNCKEVAAFNRDQPGKARTGLLDSSGNYRIRNLPDGRYRVVPLPSGKFSLLLNPKSRNVTCKGQQTHSGQQFEITGIFEG
jgi:hypothetical protein